MKSRTTVFVSGVTQEFGTFRDAVEVQLQKKGCFAENQPGFEPDFRTVEAMLRRKLHDCDAVVHIVGFRYGSGPKHRPDDAPQRSYSHMEYDIAIEMGKPVYVFLSASPDVRDEVRAQQPPEDQQLAALQLAYRERIRETPNLRYTFKDCNDLCRLVAEIPPIKAAGFMVEVSRVVDHAPVQLFGREDELRMLDDAWRRVQRAESPRAHVVTFVARAGEGTTALVAAWAAKLAHLEWPGCDSVFAWSFEASANEEHTELSCDLFLADALAAFGDSADFSGPLNAIDKGRRLAQLVAERRALLILDGVDSLQYPATSPQAGQLKDRGLAALLKGLAAFNQGLCLVTTQRSIEDLKAFRQTTSPEWLLPHLSPAAGAALLRSLGVIGLPSDMDLLVREAQGHALTLNLIGTYLRDAHGGDIRQRDVVALQAADAEELGGYAFRAMAACVRGLEREGSAGTHALELVRLLGLFKGQASAECLHAVWSAPAIPGLTAALVESTPAQRNLAISRLESAQLLRAWRDAAGALISLDTNPLLRAYLAHDLRSRDLEAWRAGHGRLFEHLCATAAEVTRAAAITWMSGLQDKNERRPTVDELQPLYQAVYHGCQAGREYEALHGVLVRRIKRGPEDYNLKKLGSIGADLGALACFFEKPWRQVLPALSTDDRAWLLSAASWDLRCLGRTGEALEPAQVATEMAVVSRNAWQSAVEASALSELQLLLGEIDEARESGAYAVKFADEDGDPELLYLSRALLGDVLHQAGEPDQACKLFEKAELLQAATPPGLALLYSWRGFCYNELLLASSERAAWRTLMIGVLPSPEEIRQHSGVLTLVERRAEQTLEWVTGSPGSLRPIDEYLNLLSIGRIALYRAMLGLTAPSAAAPVVNRVVDGIRVGGDLPRLPLGLLSHALLRYLEADGRSSVDAQCDLDEAMDLAQRGPMPLFVADIHLHRARLFGRAAGAYPWEQPAADLSQARLMIDRHRYARRLAELEDAEQTLTGKACGASQPRPPTAA